MPAAPAAVSVASTASTYATFSGILAGFAFAGLCIYISRESHHHSRERHRRPPAPHHLSRRPRQRCEAPRKDPPTGEDDAIGVVQVCAAVFFAMVSLGMASFLYANLAGAAPQGPVTAMTPGQGAAITAIFLYGIVLALSVLSLFYALALMLLERSTTKRAAKTAYWVVTMAGTITVLRFVAGSARDAEQVRCHGCDPSGVFSVPGIFVTIVIAALLSLLIAAMLEGEPKGQPAGQSEVPPKSEPKGGPDFFTQHPTFAPGGVFVAGVLVTVFVSLYINTQGGKYKPPGWLIYPGYGISIFLIALFALACGRVVAPRAGATVRFLRGRLPKRVLLALICVLAILLVYMGRLAALVVVVPALGIGAWAAWLSYRETGQLLVFRAHRRPREKAASSG